MISKNIVLYVQKVSWMALREKWAESSEIHAEIPWRDVSIDARVCGARALRFSLISDGGCLS